MTRTMKDSGIEWIGEIPEDWEIHRNKVVFSCNKEIVGENSNNTQLLSLTTGGVKTKDINSVGGKLPESFDTYQYVAIDNIIMCLFDLDMSAVFSGISNYNGMISPAYKVLKCNNNYIIPKYADYWFSFVFVDRKFTSYAKNLRYTLSYDEFGVLPITIPSLQEQQKIADFLDKKCSHIDSILEKTKASIDECKQLKQSVITQAVTKGIRPNRPMKDSGIEWIGQIPEDWEVRKIKSLGQYRNGLTYAPEDMCEEFNGTLVLRSSNVKQGKISYGDNIYVSTTIPKQLYVRKGDILVCSRNGSRDLIGKNAIIKDDITASFGAFMMIYRCDTPEYMYYILNSHIFNYYLGSFLTSTINQLTGKNFGSMNVVYCSNTTEQQEIVSYLDDKCSEIDKLITKKEKLIEELETYKKSLIYEYVTGKKEVI